MNIRKSISILAVGVLALGALSVFTIHTVNAQAPTPTPSAAPSAAPEDPSTDGSKLAPRGMRGMRGEATQADLAAALGITVEQLQAAQASAQAEALKQAVSQGLITQEQADRIAANGRGFRFGGKRLMGSGIDMDTLLADALNISVEELQAARTEAFNAAVDRAVAEGTLTQEQADLLKGRRALFTSETFQSSMNSAFEAAVAQAVQDGVITQAQADLILQNSQQRGGFHGWGGGFDGPHGFGGRGRHGGPGGAFPSTPDTQQTPATPSSNGA